MIKSIIVDDEEHGRRALELKLREYCPDIDIIAICTSAQEAINAIKAKKPQLVFLDVRLDQKTGFDVMTELENIPFEVIFVSGYDEYAIRGFREGAIDYIIKPIDVEELKAAVNKAKVKWENRRSITRIAVPIPYGIRIIPINDIIFCKAEDNITRIFLESQRESVMTTCSLKETHSRLPHHHFYRLHKSYMINLAHVVEFKKSAGGSVILSNGREISASPNKKDELMELLQRPINF